MNQCLFLEKEEEKCFLKSIAKAPKIDQLQFLIVRINDKKWLIASRENHSDLATMIQDEKWPLTIEGGGEMRIFKDRCMLYGTSYKYDPFSQLDILSIESPPNLPLEILKQKEEYFGKKSLSQIEYLSEKKRLCLSMLGQHELYEEYSPVKLIDRKTLRAIVNYLKEELESGGGSEREIYVQGDLIEKWVNRGGREYQSIELLYRVSNPEVSPVKNLRELEQKKSALEIRLENHELISFEIEQLYEEKSRDGKIKKAELILKEKVGDKEKEKRRIIGMDRLSTPIHVYFEVKDQSKPF